MGILKLSEGGKSMPQWLDTRLTVESETDEAYTIRLPNGEGFEIRKDELDAMLRGELIDAMQVLKANLVIRLALSGINSSDTVRLKREIESVSFKYFR